MKFTDVALLAAAALPSGVLSASTNNSSNSGLLSSIQNLGIYDSAYQKAKALVAGLNTTEKVTIITGGSLDGKWTALESKDGVSGVNLAYYVSSFPLGNALAMSWNKTRVYDQFLATGSEFYGLGYNLINGPEPGPLGRTPWGGRAAEAFSPDPYLSGIMMAEAISGENDAGVISCGRHWLFNEQETNRSSMSGGSSYSSVVNDKTTHELYAWPFADGVHAGMGAMMCAMNSINGTASCEHEHSLTGILKAEFGFPGLVSADVGGQKTAFGSANGGLDYGSSQYWSDATIEAGLKNGTLTEARLDDMAIRNVIGYYYVGLDDGEQPSVVDTSSNGHVQKNHKDLIRQVGAESMVLLKNDASVGVGLPLTEGGSITVFGAHAGWAMSGPNQEFSVMGSDGDVYQGHLTCPTGSGAGSSPYTITPQLALTLRQREAGGMIWWITNDTISDSSSSSDGSGMGGGSSGGMGGGMPSMGSNSTGSGSPPSMGGGGGGGGMGGGGGGMNFGGTAVSHTYADFASTSSQACLVFLNALSGEGADRGELFNEDQDSMVLEVANNCNNTIVVINTVGPRLMENWIEHDNVTAVLYGGLLGQESGFAITDVLYGDVNPSGKLAHTIGKNATDYPVSICDTAVCDFSEGVYIDYRWFDAKNITPRYEFGHGLSYTTFKYGAVEAKATAPRALQSRYPTGPRGLGGHEDLFDEVVKVTTSISNTGKVAGAEVAQLYVSFPKEAQQPSKILRGFDKVHVPVGGHEEVSFSIRRRDLSYWDVTAQKWAVAKGEYNFSVGASFSDIKGTATLRI
ncbi:glycoside hydrolase superfamily [Aspergillus stella-maris]|uniref:glycoside hydrolase superfamily n=1 Tax=Aspergillus stella-maris TaxID=1810926 RepID=UPI003CCD9548